MTLRKRLWLPGVGILLAAFIGLACASRLGVALPQWDEGITDSFIMWRSPGWSRAFWAFTLLGDDSLMGALSVALVVLVATWGRRDRAVVVAGGMALAWVVMHVAKWAVGRVRPQGIALIDLPGTHSMPSGYALISVVFWGLVAYVLYRSVHSRRERAAASRPEVGIGGPWVKTALAVLAVLLAAAVGVSRVYLGVHWMSDVLAGWCLGGAVLLLALRVATAWDQGRGPRRLRDAGRWRTPRTRVVVVGLVLAMIAAAAAVTALVDPLL